MVVSRNKERLRRCADSLPLTLSFNIYHFQTKYNLLWQVFFTNNCHKLSRIRDSKAHKRQRRGIITDVFVCSVDLSCSCGSSEGYLGNFAMFQIGILILLNFVSKDSYLKVLDPSVSVNSNILEAVSY